MEHLTTQPVDMSCYGPLSWHEHDQTPKDQSPKSHAK